MKKMSKANASKIYKASSKWNDTKNIDFAVGDGVSVPVKVNAALTLSDSMEIVKFVMTAAFIDGEYNRVYHYGTLARCIVEFFTDIPLPTYEDGTADINLCYQIVFGRNGLKTMDDDFCDMVEDLEFLTDEAAKDRAKRSLPVNELPKKILDLYEYTKYILNDMAENPSSIVDRIADFMAGIDESVLDNEESSNLEVIDGGKDV